MWQFCTEISEVWFARVVYYLCSIVITNFWTEICALFVNIDRNSLKFTYFAMKVSNFFLHFLACIVAVSLCFPVVGLVARELKCERARVEPRYQMFSSFLAILSHFLPELGPWDWVLLQIDKEAAKVHEVWWNAKYSWPDGEPPKQ